MPRYRVTVVRDTTEVVEAENPYMAAIAASEKFGDCEVRDVVPAVGRPRNDDNGQGVAPTRAAQRKRRAMSPEGRANLAKNLVKARAVRAARRDDQRSADPAVVASMGIRRLQKHALKQGVPRAYRMRRGEILDTLAAMAPTA